MVDISCSVSARCGVDIHGDRSPGRMLDVTPWRRIKTAIACMIPPGMTLAVLPAKAQQSSPSFDCRHAGSEAEQAICQTRHATDPLTLQNESTSTVALVTLVRRRRSLSLSEHTDTGGWPSYCELNTSVSFSGDYFFVNR